MKDLEDKKIRRSINDLYLDLVDVHVDTHERYVRHKIADGEAAMILTAVLNKSREKYNKLKQQNPGAQHIFIESDKKMNKLFSDVEFDVKKHNANLTMQI